MKQVGKDSVEFIDRATGLTLCRRAGIEVMCVGSYTKAGPLFLTELQLVDVNTGQDIGGVMRAKGRGAESFFENDGIIDNLAKQVSRGVGVSQLRTQTTLKPVSEVTTSSIEALQYYQRGKLEREKLNLKDARSFLELAAKKTQPLPWPGMSLLVVS